MRLAGRRTRVFLGDTELRGVRALTLTANVDEAITVHLDLYAVPTVTVEDDRVVVRIPVDQPPGRGPIPGTRAIYIRAEEALPDDDSD